MLLTTLISGFLLWVGSELLEIIEGGYTPAVYYMTSGYHLLAGFGIWALHMLQSQQGNRLSAISVALISVTYFTLSYFPIQVLNSGLSVSEFLTEAPLYKLAGGLSLLGFILFGISVIRSKHFPVWTGIVLILGTLIYAFAMSMQLSLIVNINNIVLSVTVLYMCFSGLKDK